MSRRLALFDSLRDAWPLYLSLACALGFGYVWHAVVFQTGLRWAIGAIVVACAALGFAVPDLWLLFPALTILPAYVVSTLALDNSTHNLLGIEIILYAFMTLPGLAGAWFGQVLRRRQSTVTIYPEHHSRVRTAKNIGGTILIVGILLGPVAASIGLRSDREINELKWAIRKGEASTVRAILDRNTSPNSRSQGWTMLMHAAGSGDYGIVKVLLERGADANGKGNDGATALTVAAEHGFTDIGRLLLQYQANVNARNANGSTALMYAAENCHKDLADALLKAGADLTLHDKDGESALMIARRRGHMDIERMLMLAGAKDEKPLAYPDKRLAESRCKHNGAQAGKG